MKKIIIFFVLFGMCGFDTLAQSKQFLYIEFTPADATLLINGVEQETTDGVFESLMTLGREYNCTISKEGYKTEHRRILMSDPNSTYAIEVNLNRIPKYGSILIKSDPSRADIYIDGQYAGQTPRYIPEILTGQHIVKVFGIKHDINIEEGKEKELMVIDEDEFIIEDEDFEIGILEDVEEEYVEEVYEEEEAIPFQLVEEKPSFQGGDANTFSKWVNERLVYPEIAKENGVQGRVILSFTVEKDGSITKVRVLRPVDPSLDQEAIRLVSSSPKWKPGKQRGMVVPVTYTFPVIFQIR
jgi:TonB family protein